MARVVVGRRPDPGRQDHGAGCAALGRPGARGSPSCCRGCGVPADCCHRASRGGQDDGPGVVGRGGTTGRGLGRPGSLRQPAGSLLVLCGRRAEPGRRGPPEDIDGRYAGAGGRPPVPAPARVGAGRPGSARDAGPRRLPCADRARTCWTGLTSCCGTWGPASAWWSPRGWIRRCRCTVTGWPGELTEIRAGDLAFSVAEAGLLMAQHGSTLPGGAECLR